MEGVEDDEFDLTRTVTICLDDAEPKDSRAAQLNGAFDDIQTPSTSDFALLVDPEIKISQIPQPIAKVLQLRLNPPAIGSMRNWEYIFALMGMSMDEISVLRYQPNPMAQCLESFGDVNLNQLLSCISDVNRIDVLISLRPHLKHISANLVKRQRPTGQATIMQAFNPTKTPPRAAPQQELPPKFILVTHHEVAPPPNQQPPPNEDAAMQTTDSGLSTDTSQSSSNNPRPSDSSKKKFKHLLKNLKTWGTKDNIPVFDIDNCINESNTMQSLERFFNQATHIILVVSKAYYDEIYKPKSPTVRTNIALKRQLHEFMNMEYKNNGQLNERFRVVLLDSHDVQYLPMGWPSSTLIYTFPENHAELAGKLFGK